MADNKNEQLLGLNLNVSQEFIAKTLKDAVSIALANTLDEKDKCLQNIIESALSVKVDDKGKISAYSSDNRYSFVEYYVRNAIMEETKEVLKEVVAERKNELHKMLKKQLSSARFANAFMETFVGGMLGAFESTYRSNINISFEKRERY